MGKPKTPDPYDTAAAQTGQNISTATANAWLNNPNIITPDYTQKTTQVGTQKVWDPNALGKKKGGYVDIPQMQVQQTLSPQQQAIKNRTDAAKLNLGGAAMTASKFIQNNIGKNQKYDPTAHMGWSMGLYDKISGKREQAQRSGLQNTLSNQGIKMGNDAYTTASMGLEEQLSNQRDRFALDSYGQGMATHEFNTNNPYNQINALMSSSQIAGAPQANYQGSNIPTTDIAGLVMQDYQNRMQRSGAIGANVGGALSGLGSLLTLSDRRAKTDIKKVAKTSEGLGIFSYRYKGQKGIQLGLMAQEVEKKNPSAVVTGADGLKRVDYGIALGGA